MERTKTLHKYVGHTLHALMLALLFLWCGNASAEVTGTGTKADPYIFADDIEGLATADGVQFTATGYQLYAVFTPAADGILVISSNFSQFTDKTFATMGGTQPTWDGKYPQQAKLQCTAGTTYYVGGSMPSSNVTIKYLAEDEPLKITGYSPEEGSTFDVIKGTVNLEFNKKVSISGCLVTFGNQTLNPGVLVQNAYASVDVKKQIMAAYNNGSLHEGDEIKFTFSGIKDAKTNALLNGNGTFEVTYTAPAKPMSLVSSVNTPSAGIPVIDFKSYYMKGDATSVVTVTFSDAIGSVGGVTLTFGNIDGTGEDDAPSQYYREEVPYTIDGNSIVIDFKDKLRRFADMLPGVDLSTIAPQFQDRFKTMNLSIKGVKDVNGNLAYSDGQGALGSYGFVYNFKEIDYSVATDWTVDGISNASITSDTKTVELWLQETGGKAVFTGVKFAYKENGEDKTTVVPFSSLTVADDESDKDAKLYTIPVPDVNMDEGTVTISLDGVEAPDGVEHNDYSVNIGCGGRTAATSEFAVTKAEWTNGTNTVDLLSEPIEALTKSSTISFAVNAECGYVMLEIKKQLNGSETEEVLKTGTIYPASITTADGVSSFVYTVRGAAVNVTKDATFNVTVKAWKQQSDANGPGLNNPNVGVYSFNLISAGEAYVYSDVVLQSHIADPYLLMNSEETTYTLEFSGPATVKKVILNEGQGMSSECEVKAVEGSNDQTWIVTIPASALSESQILINVFAEDKEHRAINKALDYTNPTDGGDNVWLPITLEAEFNKPAFTVEPASESVVEKIDVITFSYSDAINLSYAISDKIKIITNGGRTLLYELGFDDVKRPEGYEGTDKLCIVLDKPITEVGNYTIDVPSGFFNLGEQFEGGSSRAATIYYEIKAQSTDDVTVTLDPAPGTVTEIPEKIIVTLTEAQSAGANGINPTLTDEKGNSYGIDLQIYWDGEWNQLEMNLANGAITADGTYTLTIPAGALTWDDNSDNVNKEDIVFTYIIGTSTGIDNIVANAGGKVDVYTINGVSVLRNADAAAVKALKKGLYIINGKKVVIM